MAKLFKKKYDYRRLIRMKNQKEANKDLKAEEITRYERQIILPEIGEEGQLKLKNSAILCVGSGGLGSPALMYLAASGVGKIGIIDFDKVDSSNLQRQIIHGESWIGKAKVESASSRIHDINSSCEIETYNYKLTTGNALDIIKKYDVVVR